MVTKTTKFKGATIQDKLTPLSNFTCNDGNNLKWNPPSGTTIGIQGEANNRFLISEYIAPVWSKVTVNYAKTATYGTHDGQIEVYGVDNLGLETLLYQTKIDQTETGLQNFAQIDMLKSACTSAVYSLDDETDETLQRNIINLDMPKLRESYDDVSLLAAWYDPTNYPYRKGIAVNLSQSRRHAQVMFTADYGKDDAFSTPKALMDEYWYATVKVEYNAHMQTDFGDLKFCGFDGVTPIEHWIYSKSDSNYAYCMLRIPWYFGYYESDTYKSHSTYQQNGGQGSYKGAKKYTNPDVKFIWMYYGNATDSNSTTPVSGVSGYKEFDDFTTDTSSQWTQVNNTADTSLTWDGSSSLDLQINANKTSANGWCAYKSLPSSCFDSKGNPSYDIIWKLENIPTTAGNYDVSLIVGDTPTTTNAYPTNGTGLWISAADVYAVKIEGGAATAYTAGSLSFNHDDTEPLYVKLRVHKTHQTHGHGSIQWWISKDCKNWSHVVNLIYRTDFNADPATWNKHVLRMSSWAAAPAFNMELDVDWYMVTESHDLPKRRYMMNHFEFNDINYNDTGWGTDASATIAVNAANSTCDFAITGGAQRWDGGLQDAPMLIHNQYAAEDGLVYEAKIIEANRTGGGVLRAGISVHSDNNKHFDCQYQLYSSAGFNREMRGSVTYGGANYTKHEESYERQAAVSATVPMYMRIIVNGKIGHMIGQYSRDGWNWITQFVDSYYSFADVDEQEIFLCNDSSGPTGTAKFDYWFNTHATYIADMGGYLAYTAEQAYTDWDDIQPYSDTSWTNWYSDDFEDNKYTARTYPYRDYTVGGAETLSLVSNTLGADTLADNQGQFETSVAGLTAVNNTITQSSTVAQSGTYSAKMVATAQDSYGAPGGDYAAGTWRLGMGANTSWYLHGYVYPTSANHIGDTSYHRACKAVLFYRDSSGTIREVQSEGPTVVNTWNEIKFRFYIPTGATAAAIRLYNGVNGATCYWDNVTLQAGTKPLSGSYTLKATSNTATDSANAISLFENPHTGYTSTFKWTQLLDGNGLAGDLYHRLWLLRGTDEYSWAGIDFIQTGGKVYIRVVDYTVGSGTQLNATIFRNAINLIPQKEYEITVIDSGTNVTVYVDGTKYIDNYSYYAGNYVAHKYPGTYTGLGSNRYSIGYWDDIVIKPGYWYNGIQYTSPALTTVATSNYPANRTWQPIYDTKTRYKFLMPTGYVRNQPMIVQWKDPGASSFQYSKKFYPRMGGVFKVGPNGLDKYIGMRTRVLFNGSSTDAFKVDEINYEYEV